LPGFGCENNSACRFYLDSFHLSEGVALDADYPS